MPFFQIQLETVDFQVSYVGLLEGMITRETHTQNNVILHGAYHMF